MNNTRFATVLHILTLLAQSPDQWLSSDWIAGSIQINPVIVRKELGLLQNYGWVVSKKGKEGGSMLGIPAKDIHLGDIYQAVKSTSVLGKKNQNPNPKCAVGKIVNIQLEKLFNEADLVIYHSLAKKTLDSFVKQF